MRLILNNVFLSSAIFISVLFHTVVLLVHFVPSLSEPLKLNDTSLEIILVNAKHDKRPTNAQDLAQVDLDGGGLNDQGRSKSPLPDMRHVQDGDDLATLQKKIQELEENQKRLHSKVQSDASLLSRAVQNKQNTDEQKAETGQDDRESKKALARAIAEISQTIEDQNKRPRKTYLSPSTRGVEYAIYSKALQKKIEDVGTINFPQLNGKKLYGQVIVYIPIFQDGTIYEKEGGPRVEKSSGNPELDAAALRIVRKSAPFDRFPPNMRTKGKDDVWWTVKNFSFTRDQKLETQNVQR